MTSLDVKYAQMNSIRHAFQFRDQLVVLDLNQFFNG
jgi:hypothetical protein